VIDPFYGRVLRALLADGWLRPDDRILVTCGGPVDRDALLAVGCEHVVVTNLDERMVGDEYAPYEWRRRDAEHLDEGEDSVDWAIVHAGLHHCASPHAGLAELVRVARRGALAFEARDSLLLRAAARCHLVEDYEVSAVAANGGGYGGVRNSAVPNHVYRWTEREVTKTARSLLADREVPIRFFYGVRPPVERLQQGGHRGMARVAAALAPAVARVAPKQGNEFAFAVRTDGPRHPWLRRETSEPGT
jgi:SAM-dependent methyltransferase